MKVTHPVTRDTPRDNTRDTQRSSRRTRTRTHINPPPTPHCRHLNTLLVWGLAADEHHKAQTETRAKRHPQ